MGCEGIWEWREEFGSYRRAVVDLCRTRAGDGNVRLACGAGFEAFPEGGTNWVAYGQICQGYHYCNRSSPSDL